MAMTYADPFEGTLKIVQRQLPEFRPKTLLGLSIFKALPFLPLDLAAEIVDRIKSAVVVESSLALKVIRASGRVEEHGIVSRKVVTDAGVNFIVDAFQNSTEVENFKYHALGTGSTAEAAGQTALVTELTTEYTGNVRATGTTTEGATANVYRTVATNTLDETPGAALREHGIFSASSAGTLLDRSVFAAINLSSGDSLQSTYDLTFSSGG